MTWEGNPNEETKLLHTRRSFKAPKKSLNLHEQAQQEHKQKPLSDLHNSIPSL
jgi:hypothetical protein